jgi:poly(hydroxyalkanoate) granule-associated protein
MVGMTGKGGIMDTEPMAEGKAGETKEKYTYPMTEMIRKVVLAAIGATAIAHDEMEAFVNRLVERGEMAEKDGRSLVYEMKEKRKTRATRIEDEIHKHISEALDRMNIPTKADVDSLNVRIAELSRKIDELNKPGGA